MQEWFETVSGKFVMAFVEGDRWKLYLKGLGVTIEIAFFAAVLGLLIGTLVALMRLSVKRNGKKTLWSRLAGAYIDVIRGTPSVLQLLIMWFIVMKSCKNGTLVAVLSFGINSGAYVAEIVRAGILAVDKGQTEAGRSLGLTKAQTMIYIVMPQAFKNVLPALGNEFIVLLKETSVAGYIAVQDLTKGADIIRSRTFSAFMPLMAAAMIYLSLVTIFSYFVQRLERRLRNSDH